MRRLRTPGEALDIDQGTLMELALPARRVSQRFPNHRTRNLGIHGLDGVVARSGRDYYCLEREKTSNGDAQHGMIAGCRFRSGGFYVRA